jgi:hypothetical protein
MSKGQSVRSRQSAVAAPSSSPYGDFRTVEPWSDIDPSLVGEGGGVGPAFPLDLLLMPWHAWIADTARAAGAPADYVVQSVLAAVAGVCGAGAVVRVTASWSEPLVLRQALVGRRSNGKSPALAAMRGLLARYEAELKESDSDRAPRLVVGDAGTKALADALATRPQGVLLWRDEASSWFADLDEPASANAPRSVAPVSVLGSMRPDDLMAALADGNDGFAARFLYAWPDPPPYCRLVERRRPADEHAFACLRRVGRAAGTLDKPLALALDEAAVKAFDAFLAGLHVALRSAEGLEADWMGKGGGAVARLAGVLELLAWSGSDAGGTPRCVGAAAMESAVRLWNDYFRPHANLVFDRAGPTDLQRQARRVVRWLKANGRSQVTREDVRRHALCGNVTAARTGSILGRLWSGGVLRPAPRSRSRRRAAGRLSSTRSTLRWWQSDLRKLR